MNTYRILSLDGGGIRGVLTARMLVHVTKEYPNFLTNVDLIAGTSAGALNAVGLTFPAALDPTGLVGIYQQYGSKIFDTSIIRKIETAFGFLGSKYDTEGRRSAMIDSLRAAGNASPKEVTLEQLVKKVLICTFQLDSENPISPSPGPRDWKAKLFHNFERDNGGKVNTDLVESAIDVAVMSSAAPVYFPIFEGFVDGGVFANNPVMCAVAQALNLNEFSAGKLPDPSVNDLRVVSIGTGQGKRNYVPQRDDQWGFAEWGMKLIDLLVDSASDVADYQACQLLDDQYWRLNPPMDADIPLDDYEAVPQLIEIADKWAQGEQFPKLVAWLNAGNW
jgi:patatin-like phospholipase/acyl hydrolase